MTHSGIFRVVGVSAALLIPSACGTSDPSHGAAKTETLLTIEHPPEGTVNASQQLHVTRYDAGHITGMWNKDGLRFEVTSPRTLDGKLTITFISKDKKHPLEQNLRLDSLSLSGQTLATTIPAEDIETFLKENDLDHDDAAVVLRATGKMSGISTPVNEEIKITFYDTARWPREKPVPYKPPNGKKSCTLTHDESTTVTIEVPDGNGGSTKIPVTTTETIKDGTVDFTVVDGSAFAIVSNPKDGDDKLDGTITIVDDDEQLTVDIDHMKKGEVQLLGVLPNSPLKLQSVTAELRYERGFWGTDAETSCTIR